MNISMTTVAIPMTREHVKRLVEHNRRRGDKTRQAVLNVIRHVDTPVSPHTIKEILDTAAHSKTRQEYEQGTFGKKMYDQKIKDETIDIRTIHRKLSILVQEGVIKNQHGVYELTLKAKSDIRYFAGEFGKDLLKELMWMYHPGENSIERDIDFMTQLFGIYIVLCFVETARPVSSKSGQSRKGGTSNDELALSCLQNIVRVEEMFGYFLSVLDYILSDDKTRVAINERNRIRWLDQQREYPDGWAPSALELELMRNTDKITRNRSIISATRLVMDEIERKGEHISHNYSKDYLSGIPYHIENEVDPVKLEVISKALEKVYPNIYRGFGSFISSFRSNPKQKIVNVKETW